MPNPWDELPLNTPTVVADNGDVQQIATRTANGGTLQDVAAPGGPTDLRNQRDARLAAQVATLRSWSTTARGTTVTPANQVAVTQAIVNNLAVFYDRFADLLQSLGRG